MATEEISPDFPFEKKRVNTLDSFMAYVDTGHPSTAATTTVVFVHGNPTSSYLWRNVIPHVSPGARCVAPDLVGFGDSGKMPSGGYYIKEHIEYFAAFMEAVVPANEKVVFVIHDWGSGLGFDWARKNEQRMAGLVCMEFIHMMVTTEDFVGWERNLTKMRDPETGHKCVIEENYFVEVILREEGTSKGPLPDAIMEHYRRPFAHPADREPQWRMPNEIPLEGRAPEVGEILYKAWNWLKEGNNQVPKLLFSVTPGMLVPPHRVKDVSEWMGNPPVVRLGNSGHFPQEEHPHRVGEETRRFVDNLLVGK